MVRYGFSLFGMLNVVSELILKVGEVGTYLYIVVVGLERSLHKPCLTCRTWHHRHRVGRHDPLEVARHVVALKSQNELISEVVADGHLIHAPFGMLPIVAADVAKVTHRVAKILLEKSHPLFLVLHLATKDNHVLFLAERNLILHKDEVAHLVQLQQHTVGIVALNRSALHYRRHFGDEIDVAWQEHPAELRVKPPCTLHRVKPIDLVPPLVPLAHSRSIFWQMSPWQQLAAVVHTPHDIVLVGACVKAAEHTAQSLAEETVGHKLQEIVLRHVSKLVVLAAV